MVEKTVVWHIKIEVESLHNYIKNQCPGVVPADEIMDFNRDPDDSTFYLLRIKKA